MITMYDSIYVPNLPRGARAYAGYVDGKWPTFRALEAAFPGAELLSIAAFPASAADCLDVEPGDAAIYQIYDWYRRQKGRGVKRPCIYSSAWQIDAIVRTMRAAGVAREDYRLWSAHYASAHVCGPDTCRETAIPCDGTQWRENAPGANGSAVDESLLADGFFGGGAPVAPPPDWTEKMISNLPTLEKGAFGRPVRRVQALCVAAGVPCLVDGSFGPATEAAVKRAQADAGLAEDGIVGRHTWEALVTG